MKLNKEIIHGIVNDAINFYNIIGEEYKDNCFITIENLDDNTLEIINNLYNSFYIKKESIDKYRNKSIEELFGKDISFITNIILLLGYTVHKDNLKYFDNNEITTYKKRLYETLTYDIYFRKHKNISISLLLWGVRLINTKIIEVGRLQYEIVNINPINNTNGNFIKIHIPGNKKLLIYDVLKSLQDSKYYIKKYFKIDNPEYYCSSWLLSPEVRKIVSNESNIANFSDLFDIEKVVDGKNDILRFVFNIESCQNYNELSENTTLQKELKSLLINNVEIHSGIGKLKKC